MRRRINVTLREETLDLIDRAVRKGDRSRFIDEAVRHFLDRRGKETLRRLLEKGAVERADRDLQLTSEWFTADEEKWRDEEG